MITIYGIRNCDTMKKAMRWLDEHAVEYHFHDYRKQGLDRRMLEAWEIELGWGALLNRRGQLWRKLPPSVRDGIDRESALKLMTENPGIVKRPLLDVGDRRVLGFSPEAYGRLF
ncbi:MAG: ArsC family reductase [Gammaproteobacteria bacterium]|jgi:Spx/MgsR family transcriptional regulator